MEITSPALPSLGPFSQQAESWNMSRTKQVVIGRIMTGIYREDRRNFGDQRTEVYKELCTVLVDLYLV